MLMLSNASHTHGCHVVQHQPKPSGGIDALGLMRASLHLMSEIMNRMQQMLASTQAGPGAAAAAPPAAEGASGLLGGGLGAELFKLLQQMLSGGGDSATGQAGAAGQGGGGGSCGIWQGGPSLADTVAPGAGGAMRNAAASPGPAAGEAAPAGAGGSANGAQATASAGGQGASGAGGLSTEPQTAANTPQQSQQVAEQYMSNLQKDFGLTREQAAGIVGNLWHESGGMNSGIEQGGRIGEPNGNMADDNANGYGMCQWGGVRKQALLDTAAEMGVSPSSQAANYEHLKRELSGPYKNAIDAVKSAGSVEQATQAFCNTFEKPSDPQMASRVDYAMKMM